MELENGGNYKYRFIINEFTPRAFPEGWNSEISEVMSAIELIKIASIHMEESVTVDVELCQHNLQGRTLKEYAIPEYLQSFEVSD